MDGTSPAPRATGRSREGPSGVAAIASLPWNWSLVKGTNTPGKAEKRWRKESYLPHVTARHNTCAHGREVYLPRARCGTPGTRAAAGEEGRQEPGRAPTRPDPDPTPLRPHHTASRWGRVGRARPPGTGGAAARKALRTGAPGALLGPLPRRRCPELGTAQRGRPVGPAEGKTRAALPGRQRGAPGWGTLRRRATRSHRGSQGHTRKRALEATAGVCVLS